MNRREFLMAGASTALLSVAANAPAAAQTGGQAGATTEAGGSILETLRQPPDDSRIMMRWWLFGPSVSQSELDRELTAMKDAGIGGVELSFVYPLTTGEDGLKTVSLLSDEFAQNIKFISERARELGLRLDITGGSGWSFGGKTIEGDLAAHHLRHDVREIAPSLKSIPKTAPFAGDRMIAAFVGRGSIQEKPAHLVPLDISGDSITIPDGDGPRVIHLYYAVPTGQVVKRSAVGAEGYVLDHYSAEALEQHLKETTGRLVGAAIPGTVSCVFCDSLEVYQANWTAKMPEEFKRRRGYDLMPRLPQIFYDTGDDYRETRRDFGKTLAELYAENFLKPMKAFAEKNKVLFRVQNYGVPPSTISSHRFVDLANGEGWGWRTMTSSKWASSAAAIFGQNVVASETWTWAHSPSFRATPLDIKGEAHEHFLLGINQLIGHGWPYSPPEAGKPGWMFYASTALNDNNAWWPVMGDLSRYLQRTSALLQRGVPVNEVAILVSNDDALASFKPTDNNYMDLWRRIRDRLDPHIVEGVLDAGLNYVIVDDGSLSDALEKGIKAVVVPTSKMLDPASIERLRAYRQEGGEVVFVANDDAALSDFTSVGAEDVSSWLVGAIGSDLKIDGGGKAVGFVHRKTDAEEIYFVANTGNTSRHVRLRPRESGRFVTVCDCHSGEAYAADVKGGGFELELAPYEARVVAIHDADWKVAAAPPSSGKPIDQAWSAWNIQVGDTPARAGNLPFDWSTNPETKFFSGGSLFETSVKAPAIEAGQRVWLDFGDTKPIEREPTTTGTLRGNSFAALIAPPIREAAVVVVNGKEVGSLFAPPYRIDVTDAIIAGDNRIEIRVYNTSINLLAKGGLLPDMPAVYDKYGQRAVLQDLDVILPLASGLFAQPTLVAAQA